MKTCSKYLEVFYSLLWMTLYEISYKISQENSKTRAGETTE